MVELGGWMLTMLSECVRCCWGVLTHTIASPRKLASHPSPFLHHAASSSSHVVAHAAEAADHVRVLRF